MQAVIQHALQVPGEMFALAMEARKRGAGVVGSTSNILDFIDAKVQEALDKPFPERVQVCAPTGPAVCLS